MGAGGGGAKLLHIITQHTTTQSTSSRLMFGVWILATKSEISHKSKGVPQAKAQSMKAHHNIVQYSTSPSTGTRCLPRFFVFEISKLQRIWPLVFVAYFVDEL